MGKVRMTLLLIGALLVVYLIMLVTIPVITDIASSVNTTMAASTNMTNFPGAQGALLGAPWWLWWAPFGIGCVVEVQILRSGKD